MGYPTPWGYSHEIDYALFSASIRIDRIFFSKGGFYYSMWDQGISTLLFPHI
ncbi:hypothetical protein P175DRAFT_0285456 [Aspergillus ochraceoroseus IBT 24754]|uniref:Uncharacterized protein n=1 Tax=Aspergillus ochraceoroseus IBT 24754 TaxID=1392256 RepID=A0A2T5LW24_9EURO|nr:uncharacterized protein P175DRAFT_0285456 [Aspergillus ochraceoroseus IBT 24754]PTU20453.1 hypothetical protein P175DRAFT_0285456 [Aspergillus ochraceoroseus IBT 24754]